MSASSKEEVLEERRVEDRREGNQQGQVTRSAADGVMAFILVGAGVVAGGTGAWIYSIRPRDPVFEVVAISLKGFNLRFCTDSPMLMAVIDVELTLSIKVTNDNVAPIEYTSTIMDIYYRGNLLGQAQVKEGTQEAKSSKVLEVPCKLDGLEMTNHVTDLFKDVTKREMNLHSVVTIAGRARLWKWTHNFEVHVTSEIKVDPIFLNIIDQENKVEMEFESPI
ncbi:unnamed protein product [Calypogeia fissa]